MSPHLIHGQEFSASRISTSVELGSEHTIFSKSATAYLRGACRVGHRIIIWRKFTVVLIAANAELLLASMICVALFPYLVARGQNSSPNIVNFCLERLLSP
jgi:hypothetical protein